MRTEKTDQGAQGHHRAASKINQKSGCFLAQQGHEVAQVINKSPVENQTVSDDQPQFGSVIEETSRDGGHE